MPPTETLPDLASYVLSRKWRFRSSTGTVYCESLRLLPDGTIWGYARHNEHSWRLENGHIEFLSRNGQVSTRFRIDADDGGPVTASGPFLLNNRGIVHFLEETESRKFAYPVRFRWTNACDDFCEANKIFFRHTFQPTSVCREGDPVEIASPIQVEAYASMAERGFHSSGAFSYTRSRLPPTTRVGRYSSIASGVTVMSDPHPLDRFTTSPVTYNRTFETFAKDFGKPFNRLDFDNRSQPPVIIGNDVWIGDDALLKPGIRIGDGAIIGARAVVTKDVAPFSKVVGNPAVPKKPRFPDALAERMQRNAWWNFNYVDLPTCWMEPERFLDELEEMVAGNRIEPFRPRLFDLATELADASFGAS